MYSENSIKLLVSPFLVMFQTFLTRRAFKGHSRDLGTQTLRQSKGTWVLKTLKAFYLANSLKLLSNNPKYIQ